MNKKLVELVAKVLEELEKCNGRLTLTFHKVFLNAIVNDDEDTMSDIVTGAIAALGNYIDVDKFEAMYDEIQDECIGDMLKDIFNKYKDSVIRNIMEERLKNKDIVIHVIEIPNKPLNVLNK